MSTAFAYQASLAALNASVSPSFAAWSNVAAVAMCVVLSIYLALWLSRGLPGAPLIVAGIALSSLAAVEQATTMRVRFVVPFDHNGLFHLIQLLGMGVLAAGVRLARQTRT